MNNTLFNRKAKFNYLIEDTYNSGIVLVGCEVKSIREGMLNFNDSYCLFVNNELWVRGLYISENKYGQQIDPSRDRKLLLNKRELTKIQNTIKERGYTIVPLKVFFNEHNIVKMEIGIGRGKKDYDKRETIKKRESERTIRNSVTT
jgi:SsrA-binding protein